MKICENMIDTCCHLRQKKWLVLSIEFLQKKNSRKTKYQKLKNPKALKIKIKLKQSQHIKEVAKVASIRGKLIFSNWWNLKYTMNMKRQWCVSFNRMIWITMNVLRINILSQHEWVMKTKNKSWVGLKKLHSILFIMSLFWINQSFFKNAIYKSTWKLRKNWKISEKQLWNHHKKQ